MKPRSYYAETKASAVASAAEWLGDHTIKDGLVRSFRFHGFSTNLKVGKPEVIAPYPFGKLAPPVEGAGFGYTSSYAFTLTWTPGTLHLSGDVGELTLTHYHAMANFDEAISWALSSDFDYLLGKSDKRPVYNRDETLKAFRHYIYEEVRDEMFGRMSTRYRGKDVDGKAIYEPYHTGGALGDLRAWRREKPVWTKCRRAGMTRKDFEAELKYWQDDKPRVLYLEERKNDPYRSFDWRNDSPSEFWDYPECLDRLIRLYIHFNKHWQGNIEDLLTHEGRWRLWDEVESKMDSEDGAADVAYGVYGDDPCITRTYTWHDFFMIACIQHGCRMIAAKVGLAEKRVAA
jgi:hypothetical protein